MSLRKTLANKLTEEYLLVRGLMIISLKNGESMNLLKNRDLLRNLLKQGDYWNAMNGGVSMTSYKTYKTVEAYIIEISAPTVSPESFNILLNINQLIVYTLFKGERHMENNMIPMFSKSFELPINADANRIDAVFETNKLRIIVPYITDLDKYKRKIDIKLL